MRFGIRELVFVVLLFCVPASVYFLVFKPRKESEARMIEESRDRQEKLEDLNRARVVAGRNLRDHIEMLKQLLKIVRSRQPEEADASRILYGLDMLANSNRLRAETKDRPSKQYAGPGNRYMEKRIRMTVQGAYFDFYAFLQAMENQPRIIRVNKLTLRKLRETKQQGYVSADLDLQIFFQRNRKRAGS
jgi:Tfp pilus assembly protein PilO